MTIIFGSVKIYDRGRQVDSSLFTVDYGNAEIEWHGPLPASITVHYRVFPILFTKTTQHKDPAILEPFSGKSPNPFSFQGREPTDNIFSPDNLSKSGSISRGIVVGNNQDLSVNSNMDLQLAGQLNENIRILASITDDNIPIQPDGNTQQLQDFDKVFIQLYNDNIKLVAGDFQLRETKPRFLQYYKRAQGATFTGNFLAGSPLTRADSLKAGKLVVGGSAAISKGKFSRNVLQGVEGNQGPYRLRGGENELFIIILAGTERVYIDGKLLERGQNADYVIDYNTAEVTFTPKELITKDRRIIVEFQYSDKNYARSLFQLNTGYSNEQMNIWIHGYSEQDSKNQPLQQDLSVEEKEVLSQVGDSLLNAVVSGAKPEAFTPDLVLYTLVDTLGSDSVYVYTTNPNVRTYRLSFSQVGEGNGNYIQSTTVANGRVFKWVAPDTVNGVFRRQGNYEPVILLIAPKKHQVVAAGGNFKLNKFSEIAVEGAVSNKDFNTFSSLDAADNAGHAFKVGYNAKKPLASSDSVSLWTATTDVSYEQVDEHFVGIERYREVEFERNWNVQGVANLGTQHMATAGLNLARKKLGNFGYFVESFLTDRDYRGIKNNLSTALSYKTFLVDFNGSMLNSTGARNTTFVRHKSMVEKGLGKIAIGYKDEHESNRFNQIDSLSLEAGSYTFYDWQTYIRTNSELDRSATIFYRHRTDQRVKVGALSPASVAYHYGLDFNLAENKTSQLSGSASYRQLVIKDPEIINQEEENTLLSRLNHRLRLFSGAVVLNTFYEIGSGQELRKSFSYLKVQPGQGVYIHIDYNDNGVQELNEFELAPTASEGLYIKVFTPTNEYARTFTNQFNQALNLTPSAVWKQEKGLKLALSKFSNQTSFRIDRKTNTVDLGTAYNPFAKDVADTSLLSLSGAVRNTIYFNRSHPVFGMDHTYQNLSTKTLLTNGFDSRERAFNNVNIRWNFTKSLMWRTEAEIGVKRSASDFLSNRDYNINYYEVKPQLSYQPGTTFRLALIGSYREKHNTATTGGQAAYINDLGTELRYNIQTKGSLLANFNYILIRYNDSENTSLAYEMLEALKIGNNFTWSLSFQRNLSKNMQMNLNYSGRKSEETKAVHTGGIQIRAFF